MERNILFFIPDPDHAEALNICSPSKLYQKPREHNNASTNSFKKDPIIH